MMDRNKTIAVAALAAAGVAAGAALTWRRPPRGNPRVPEPAKPVELERYLGQWYELARYDQRFERGCTAATAHYTLRPDGRIDVLNRCRKEGGGTKQARGVASVVDRDTNAKLKVRFFGPFGGDYWVLDHADDYAWSIVGEPSGRYLWILSRDPHPGNDVLESLVGRASDMGYDTSLLVRDTH